MSQIIRLRPNSDIKEFLDTPNKNSEISIDISGRVVDHSQQRDKFSLKNTSSLQHAPVPQIMCGFIQKTAVL